MSLRTALSFIRMSMRRRLLSGKLLLKPRDGDRTVEFVDCDKSHVRYVNLFSGPVERLNECADRDLHGCSSHGFHLRRQKNCRVERSGGLKIEMVDGDRRHLGSGMSSGADRADRVNHLQKRTAE